jgi:hypothetical protein
MLTPRGGKRSTPMSYELQVEQISGERVAIVLQGWLEDGDVESLTAAVLDICARSACRELYYDIRGFVGRPNLETSFRTASGLPHWGRALSVAFVDDSGWNHYSEYLQRLYADLGFRICFFADPESATRWLDRQSVAVTRSARSANPASGD